MTSQQRPTPRFGVAYDFRNPDSSGFSHPDLYRAVLDQIEWLDDQGLELCWFTEQKSCSSGQEIFYRLALAIVMHLATGAYKVSGIEWNTGCLIESWASN